MIGVPAMTGKLPSRISRIAYHRISADEKGGSHVDTVKVEQRLAAGAPPAAPFYVSADATATMYRFYTSQPGWIGNWHPCPARQFLLLMSDAVEMETTDGEVRQLRTGDLVLLEDTAGRGHVTRNIGEGFATFFVVPVA